MQCCTQQKFPEVWERYYLYHCTVLIVSNLEGKVNASIVIKGCPGRNLIICNESLTYLKQLKIDSICESEPLSLYSPNQSLHCLALALPKADFILLLHLFDCCRAHGASQNLLPCNDERVLLLAHFQLSLCFSAVPPAFPPKPYLHLFGSGSQLTFPPTCWLNLHLLTCSRRHLER